MGAWANKAAQEERGKGTGGQWVMAAWAQRHGRRKFACFDTYSKTGQWEISREWFRAQHEIDYVYENLKK